MATSKRDVRLGVEIETTGQEGIRRLADDVRRLAREGGEAAPEFQALAAQLDRLSTQAGSIDDLKRLGAEIEQLADRSREASVEATRLGDAFVAQKAKTDALRATQEANAAALRQTKVDLAAAQVALANFTRGVTADTRASAAYQARLAELGQAVGNLKIRQAELNAERSKAGAELRTAAAAESRLADQTERASAAARAAAGALGQRNSALTQSQAAALAAGIDIERLADAEQAVVAAVQDSVVSTNRLSDAREQAAAAARDLAAASQAQSAIDEQLAAARTRLSQSISQSVEAWERDQRAAREAALSEFEAAEASDDLAEAKRRSTAAIESELAAIRDSEQFLQRYEQAQREAAAAAEKLAAVEGAAAMRRLEEAAREADRELEQLTASLRESEAASKRFAEATERAASAGGQDVAANRARRAAAEQLIASERELSVAQRELAVARDAGRASALQEAQALLQTARAADASREATTRLVREARQAGDALESAFGTAGVRSLDAIETEIRQVERAMSLLERRMRSGAISQADFERATAGAAARIRQLKVEIATMPVEATPFQRLGAAADDLVTKYGRLTAVAATLGFAAKPLIDATIALDQTRRVLTTVTGSAEAAERQIDFLRRTAQASGQAFDQISASYSKFAASASQSGLSFQQVQDVFESVSLAAGNLGLSTDQSKRALEALSQMASKGVVSMEELRQQLGDALPGVLPLLAKELGLTQAELNKVVESGQLLAREAIPAIGRSLRALQPADGVVNGIVATFNRFINVVKEAGTTITEGPIGRLAGGVLTAFAGAIRDIAFVAVSASEGIRVLGNTVAVTAAAFANGTIGSKQYFEELDRLTLESAERLEKFKRTAYGVADGTKALGSEVTGLGRSFARLAIDNQKAIEQSVLYGQNAEKNVEAAKKEADAIRITASLLGSEAAEREAGVRAAELLVAATEKQAAADRQLIAVIEDAIVAQKADAQARYGGVEAINLSIEALDKRQQKAQADAEKSEAAAKAARAHADAIRLAARAAEDNSERFEELREEVERAEEAYRSVAKAMVNDKATSEDLERASTDLAKAKGLLADAVDDLEEATRRQVDALKADAELTKAQIGLEVTRLRVRQEDLRARGQQSAADQLGLQIKRLEISITQTATNVKSQEAAAIIRSTVLRREELRAAGELTPALEQELDTRIKQQQAVLLNAQATQVQTDAQKKNIEAAKDGTRAINENSGAQDDNRVRTGQATRAIEQQTVAYGELAQASQLWSAQVIADYNRVKAAIDGVSKARAELDRFGPGAAGARDAIDLGPDITGVRGPGDSAGPSTVSSGSWAPVTATIDTGSFVPPNLPGQWVFDQAAWQAAGGPLPQGSNDSRYFRRVPGTGPNDLATPFGGSAGTWRQPAPAPAPAPRPPASSSGAMQPVVINLGGKKSTLTGSPEQVQALIDLLEEAQRNGGGS